MRTIDRGDKDVELEDETERRGTDNKTRRERREKEEAGPRGITEERIILPAHKSFNFFFVFPPEKTSHSSAILLLLGCQIPESHLERHIITSVTITICDILLYIVNVWIPTFFHQLV